MVVLTMLTTLNANIRKGRDVSNDDDDDGDDDGDAASDAYEDVCWRRRR